MIIDKLSLKVFFLFQSFLVICTNNLAKKETSLQLQKQNPECKKKVSYRHLPMNSHSLTSKPCKTNKITMALASKENSNNNCDA